MKFEQLESVVELSLEFVTLGSLAIGAGKQPDDVVESPVIKLSNIPVIPGSSLKGALRSSLEALISARKPKSVCLPVTAAPRAERYKDKDNQERVKQDYLDKLGRIEPCPVWKPCAVCEIFGTVSGKSGLSGKAIFLDAKPVSEYALPERTHVAITRDTRSQAGSALFPIETVDAGVKFVGAIRLINPEPWQVGAILHALEWLRQLGIGSKKTAGYGQLDITVSAITRKVLAGGAWQPTALKSDEFLQAFVTKFEAKK